MITGRDICVVKRILSSNFCGRDNLVSRKIRIIVLPAPEKWLLYTLCDYLLQRKTINPKMSVCIIL